MSPQLPTSARHEVGSSTSFATSLPLRSTPQETTTATQLLERLQLWFQADLGRVNNPDHWAELRLDPAEFKKFLGRVDGSDNSDLKEFFYRFLK